MGMDSSGSSFWECPCCRSMFRSEFEKEGKHENSQCSCFIAVAGGGYYPTACVWLSRSTLGDLILKKCLFGPSYSSFPFFS